jgi:acyl-[acyl-carrier-protein]-phospholipid O-acyltransferase/long-chain-fatty-acid--[acyl-carrier-protein] ligase
MNASGATPADSTSTSKSSPKLTGLLVAQFMSIFVGNAWTLLVALLAARHASGLDKAAREAASQDALGTTFLASIVPMVLASVPAASLADRVSKTRLMRALSVLLVVAMAAGAVQLRVAPDSRVALLAIVALVGMQGALFSPAKYGILPQLTSHGELSAANGRLELATFVAIVSGSAAAGGLAQWTGSQPWIAAVVLALLAAVGLVAARRIPDVPAVGVKESVGATVRGAWSALRADRVLGLSVTGSVLFWGLAKLIGQDVLVDASDRLHLSEGFATTPLGVLAIGVGLGSVFAGRLSRRNVEVGLLPLGGLLMALGGLAIGLLGPGRVGTFVLLALLGVFSGLLLVPLNSLLQWRAPPERRGGVIALSNVFVYAGIGAGAGVAMLLSHVGLSTRAIFVVAAVAFTAGGVWATSLVPQAFVRLVLFLFTHTIYRMRVDGRDHVPEKGGALLVPNHVSFVDGLLVIASLDRPVRFLVDAPFFERPFVGRVLRWLGAIPISAQGGPRMILRAFRDSGRHLDEGHLVCVFAEGEITRNGIMNPFRRGLARIVKGRDVPIVPVHLDGVWGSVFSFSGGRFVTKLPEHVPYPVRVSFGAPLPSSTPIHEVRRAVQDLGEQAWLARKRDRRPLHHAFLRRVRRRPWRELYADSRGGSVSRWRAAAGAIALARALRPRIGGDERIGVLLPPSIGGAIANLAVAMAGRTSVNLNFVAGRAAMESAARQAGLRIVLTSAEFLAKAKVELPSGVTPLFVDDAMKAVSRAERAKAALYSLCVPCRLVERACGARRRVTVDDLVTVIFSSGSTGEPKGVMLSHFNVDSNVESLAQAFRTTQHDKFLGVLPLFHSFGFTATLWFPACKGLATVFHPSPIDAAAVGPLVERHHVTFLLTTPTLLSLYMRRCTPAQLGSLRLVLAGAERLPDRLVAAFEDQFGIRPLEGYGATECSPVIAASTPDFRSPGFYQPGFRRGFVGQPIPGVTVRVVDPETFSPLPPNTQGMLLVRGPNVMQGYLGRPDLTAKALRDGWYVTGDLARVDEDGFVQIGDRLSRFSKIGGEMVPHARIEDELHRAANATIPTFAVTALPDEKKGERLAVLHTLDESRVPDLVAKLGAAGLPNLFVPRADQFVRVEKLPLLATGKVDLRTVKAIAAERLGEGASAATSA